MDMISAAVLGRTLGVDPSAVIDWIEHGYRIGRPGSIRLPAYRIAGGYQIRLADYRRWAAAVGMPVDILPDDLRLVDCAGCGVECRAPGQDWLVARLTMQSGGPPVPAPMAGRYRGRPYCSHCWSWRAL
jgi:hypothetical protein